MQKELQMKQFDSHQLGQFTGTSKYYKISRRHLLTDGTRYLAEQAACFWLMDAIASHLSEIGTAEWFVVIKTTVKRTSAVTRFEAQTGLESHALISAHPKIVRDNFGAMPFLVASY